MATTIDYGGIVFGTTDSDGVRWRIDKDGFDGWDGSPAPTLDVMQKVRGHGALAGESFFTARYMAVRGMIVAPTPLLLDAAIDRLNDAVALDDRPFTVMSARGSRHLAVRRADEVRTPKVNDRIAMYAFQVVALDGRKLYAELTGSTPPKSSTGGLTIPFTVPFTISAVQSSGDVALTNPGREVGPVRVRIDGPPTGFIAGPIITHSSGLILSFSSALVLGAGEWLDIDMDAQTVLANGQASRSIYINSRGWSGFTPGPNVWSFTAVTPNAGALMTVTATPADK